jgi:hypothetical protein
MATFVTAGPRDPEDLFLNPGQVNSKVISTALGPRGTFSIGGIGVPPFYIEETVERWEDISLLWSDALCRYI